MAFSAPQMRHLMTALSVVIMAMCLTSPVLAQDDSETPETITHEVTIDWVARTMHISGDNYCRVIDPDNRAGDPGVAGYVGLARDAVVSGGREAAQHVGEPR